VPIFGPPCILHRFRDITTVCNFEKLFRFYMTAEIAWPRTLSDSCVNIMANTCCISRGTAVRNVSNSKRDLQSHSRSLVLVPFD